MQLMIETDVQQKDENEVCSKKYILKTLLLKILWKCIYLYSVHKITCYVVLTGYESRSFCGIKKKKKGKSKIIYLCLVNKSDVKKSVAHQ